MFLPLEERSRSRERLLSLSDLSRNSERRLEISRLELFSNDFSKSSRAKVRRSREGLSSEKVLLLRGAKDLKSDASSPPDFVS